ncbi:MAG: hypothetical protein AAF991_10045 [Pseudomonadota bacterium]
MLRSIMRFFLAVVLSVLGAYAVASVLATQLILANVESMGLAVTMRDRLHATNHDLFGLFPTYVPLLLIAFVIAMPVAVGLARLLPKSATALFVLAGFVAVLAIHLIMKQVLGLNGIAAVREVHGLLSQALAGAFGGYLYFVFSGRAFRKEEKISSPPL